MLGWGSPAVDLPALLRLVLTFVAVASGVALLLRTAASRYFAVDSVVAALEKEEMGKKKEEEEEKKCFVCGNGGIKVCSRCRSVRYCSLDCQSKHWKDDHKLKCRKQESTSMALVPPRGRSKVLRQPKKILFPYDEFVKLYYWDKQAFIPCGLLNCGNSCFANVVLQCLACTRPLVAYLLEGSHSYHCTRNVWCFLCELQTHIQTVTRSSQPFSPVKILSRLPNIGSHLGYGRQEDAHEFMRFAIDTMQSVCLDEFGGESVLDPSTQETSLIQHIFGGHLQSQVICTNCDKVSNRYENMMDLTVEIQGEGESLEDCLDQFTAKEWLDGENMYKCDGCNDYVKAWKRLTVHQPPNILTITLKRFQSGRFGKLNKRVAFPETLDLGPYMSAAGGGDNLYTLYAVVVHLDMLNASFFGHYICYVKNFSGNWYRIDDCKAIKVEVEEVLSQGAYMLLYNRLHVRPPKPIQQAEENVPQPAQVSPDISESMDTRINGELNSKSNSFTVNEEPDWMDTDEVGSASLNQIDGDPDDAVERSNIRPREPKVGENLPRETKIVDIQEPSPRSDAVVHTVSESTSNSGRMNKIIGTSREIAEVPAVSTSLNSREENLEADASSINNVNSKLVQPEVVPNPGSSYQNAIRNAASWYDDKKMKASAEVSQQSSSCASETRPLFSRGFLDRQPSKKKPLQKVRVSSLEGSSVGISTSSNGNCNGFSKPIGLASVEPEGSESSFSCPNVNNITRSSNVDLTCQTGNGSSPYEDGNKLKECLVSERSLTTFDKLDPNQKLKLGNRKEFSDFDMSFISRGFLNKPCDQPQKNICITENGIRENGSIALEESCLIDSPQATSGKGNGSLNGLPFTSKRSIDISEVPQTYNGLGKTNSSGEHEVVDHPDQQNHMTDIAPSKESQLSELLLKKMT